MSTEQQGTLVIGAVMADIICEVPHVPTSGMGVAATSTQMAAGGCAFNTASAIKRSGGACTLVAPIGHGRYASFLESELASRGIAPMHVDTSLDCGACICLVEPTGQRTMITLPGVERMFERSWLDAIDTRGYSYAIVSAFELCGSGGGNIVGFLEAHEELTVIYAPGPLFADVDARLAKRIDALHPIWHLNDDEVMAITSEPDVLTAGITLCEHADNTVIVTAGADGAWLFTRPAAGAEPVCELVPGECVDVVDTIGAGDAHVGAVAAALCAGKSWRDAVTAANHAAAKICQIAGATPKAVI